MKIITLSLTICLAQHLALGQSFAIDSLKQELKASTLEDRFRIEFELFKEFLSLDYDSSLHYASRSAQSAVRMGDSLAIVKAYNATGWAKLKIGKSTCIPDFEYALGIAENGRYTNQVKYILNNLAIANNDFANYDKALEYNFKSLEIRQQEGDPLDISIALNNIGNVYFSLFDYENALLYFTKSKDMKEGNGIQHDLDRAYVNIAITNYQLNNLELALKDLAYVLKLCEQQCKDDVLVEAHYARGQVLFEKNDLSGAEIEFDMTIEIARRIGSRRFEAQSLNSLAKARLKRKKPKEALRFLDLSQSLLEETNLRDQMLSNYLLYVSIFEDLEDFRLASQYQQKYIELNKKIFSGDLIKNISRIQAEYEERENIKTIASKDHVLLLQEEVIARQRSEYFFIITITALIVGLAMVLYWSNRKQRRANAALAEAKATIERQNLLLQDANHELEKKVIQRTQELHSSNESLRKVNEEMDNFIYKTSHDIRGPLASLKGICNVALMDVKDPVALDYFQKLDVSSVKLNNTLSRLLIINQINQSALISNPVDLVAKIEDTIANINKNGLPDQMEINYEVSRDIQFNSDRALVKIILDNLIENAVKFYNKSDRVKSFVRISAAEEDDFVVIKVIDNGIGIDESSREHIFELFIRASERSESGGIGLYLSKLAATKLGGTIDFLTSAEGLTEFTVRLPKDLQFDVPDHRNGSKAKS